VEYPFGIFPWNIPITAERKEYNNDIYRRRTERKSK